MQISLQVAEVVMNIDYTEPEPIADKNVVAYFHDLEVNRPFPSSLVPLFQSESKCKTVLMKMTLICMKMTLHAELIFIRKVSHLHSF